MEKIKSNNIRAFVSISLFVLLIILFISAVGIQVIDAIDLFNNLECSINCK
jgi:hypothetical protein